MSRLTTLLRRVVRRAIAGRQREGDAAADPDAATRSSEPATAGVPDPPDSDEPESLEVEVPIPGSLLLDIREPGELAGGVAEGAMLLPMDLVPHHLDELPRDRPITVYCAAGARSFGVAHWLREQGFAQAWSLAGGIGVFGAVGVPVRPPPGLSPGTRVRLPPDARAGAVPVGPGVAGEVVEQRGDTVYVVVHDAQGFPVRVEAPVASLVR